MQSVLWRYKACFFFLVLFGDLRWRSDEVSEQGKALKKPAGKDLYVAVHHASEEVKPEDIAINEGHGAVPHYEAPQQRNPPD